MGDVRSWFALHEVVVLTGFTKHMLDYLAREDIFRPSDEESGRRGKRRRYSYQDVVLLRALHSVCSGRGKIRFLKQSLKAFRAEAGSMTPGHRVDALLVVEGDKLCVREASANLRELATGQLAFSFVVDMLEVTNAISACVDIDKDSGVARLNASTALLAEQVRQDIWAAVKARRTSTG